MHAGLLRKCTTIQLGTFSKSEGCVNRFVARVDRQSPNYPSCSFAKTMDNVDDIGKQFASLFSAEDDVRAFGESDELRDYRTATLALLAVGLVFAVLGMVLSPCCGACNVITVLLSAITTVAGVVVFTVCTQRDKRVRIGGLEFTNPTQVSLRPDFVGNSASDEHRLRLLVRARLRRGGHAAARRHRDRIGRSVVAPGLIRLVYFQRVALATWTTRRTRKGTHEDQPRSHLIMFTVCVVWFRSHHRHNCRTADHRSA